MLYHLLYPLSSEITAFNVFRYITVRSFVSFVLATLISIYWGKKFINFIKRKQFGQVVRDDGPQSHLKKAGTPTLGGIFIVGSVFATIAITGNWMSPSFVITVLVTLSFFLLGWLDDHLKVIKKDPKGISAKTKLLWQTLTGVVAGILLIHYAQIDTNLYVPFFKGPLIDLGYGYIAFATLVIVASSNAVNLTDGLDGLAIGPIIISAATLGLLAYVTGHSEMAEYLLIPHVEDAGEIVVFAAALIGAGVGFLWYNSYPAQIFMGDVGSLSLGGALGIISVITKNELLFVLIGGIFVIETISVIMQVGSFKLRKKRVFKMAPLHHHFELSGWPETKVIVRFWIISIILGIMAIATLKLR